LQQLFDFTEKPFDFGEQRVDSPKRLFDFLKSPLILVKVV